MIHWPLRGIILSWARHYGDRTLTILLLVSAFVIILVALSVKNPLVKAALLAYIVLP